MSAIQSHDQQRSSVFARLWNINLLFSNEKFQSWASNFPFIRRIARKEGEEIFDLIMGFVNAQVVWALVKLRILNSLLDGPKHVSDIALETALPQGRAEVLMNSATALGLTKRRADGVFVLSRKGASLMGVPGLMDMIRHHVHFYRDITDPVALLRDEVDTELSHFWPYVFGASDSAPMDGLNYCHLWQLRRNCCRYAENGAIASGNKILDVGETSFAMACA